MALARRQGSSLCATEGDAVTRHAPPSSRQEPPQSPQAPSDGSSPVATAPKPQKAPSRDEDRALYRLALDLRSVSPDCAAAPGIDYERLSQRVQTSPTEPTLPHGYGRGHVRPDPVAARLTRVAGPALPVLLWLRSFGPTLEWLAADRVEAKRADLLDALANAGIATYEDARRWAAADHPTTARRTWARLRLRAAWSAWTGEAW